ncbi:MAG: hypothetical protein UY90_C0065G0009 [Candidatus Peregrinibacteria bacterium GW2011_GWA2_54_9]|nr:MAG: hypothetical protein UY90_C0065G0009 [Candidatus Peregrinibacteria bacterium GW2011_GWA2_54_9]
MEEQSVLRNSLLMLVLVAGGIAGCAPQIRIDIQCVTRPGPGAILTDCADQQTWKEWSEKQSKGEK